MPIHLVRDDQQHVDSIEDDQLYIHLVKDDEQPIDLAEGEVFWSSDIENYPLDLVEKIIEHVSKNGRQTNIENIAVGFFNKTERGVRICAVVVKFTDTPAGTQHIIFKKIGINEWEAIQESEIMPPSVGEVKLFDDETLRWTILKDW